MATESRPLAERTEHERNARSFDSADREGSERVARSRLRSGRETRLHSWGRVVCGAEEIRAPPALLGRRHQDDGEGD